MPSAKLQTFRRVVITESWWRMLVHAPIVSDAFRMGSPTLCPAGKVLWWRRRTDSGRSCHIEDEQQQQSHNDRLKCYSTCCGHWSELRNGQHCSTVWIYLFRQRMRHCTSANLYFYQYLMLSVLLFVILYSNLCVGSIRLTMHWAKLYWLLSPVNIQ